MQVIPPERNFRIFSDRLANIFFVRRLRRFLNHGSAEYACQAAANLASAFFCSNRTIRPESCSNTTSKAPWVADGIISQNRFGTGDCEFVSPQIANFGDQSKTALPGVGADKEVKSAARSIRRPLAYTVCEWLRLAKTRLV